MSKGQEQLAATVEICRALARDIEALPGLEGERVKAASAILEGIVRTLEGVADTFFLRTNLCVYFTARCLRVAKAAREALASLEGVSSGEICQGFQWMERELAGLEKAAKTLADKAGMPQEMTLT